ncbi:MAG: hypothetical protein Q8S84_07165 [bacterium]|nr:hypothetical protein [bacterium]
MSTFSHEWSEIGNESLKTLSIQFFKKSLYESNCTSKRSGKPATDLSSVK